ncbi:DNA cytosine methyltransferase [Curtobacterium sp. MCPF17_003]|uniref:DNA cytosine methyltransferase n=1 Tax=Curtobacterium sp. MCPF17_003 TaxID=2175637 RepID=UPI000D8A8C4E|nr:DNA cytosine methyltransferase [Curtobacterium sp. MCPF17_003]PYY63644.1 DNA cytosine methyltransferase [Curtobacterium sp. MCPF17_003]
MIALDLFAGTGWGVACQRLGIEEHGVELMPEAVASRTAAGMHTAYRDVWDGLADPAVIPDHDLLIASPPCQTFSVAGKGAGRKALDDVLALIRTGAWAQKGTALRDAASAAGLDDRTALVLSPLAYVAHSGPVHVVLEQVPAVLPVWEAVAREMRALGYSVVTGVLGTEQYGVPQTRRRAILVARRDGLPARMPEPTHSRFYSRDPERRDPGVLPWVSMADALGWGMTGRPSPTITGGGTETGGAEPIAKLARYTDRADWVQRSNYSNNGRAGATAEERGRTERALHEPSVTITSKVPQWDSPTSRVRLTPSEAAVLQSYPADFPFQGNRGKRFLQIGNAVPPLLGQAVITAALAGAVQTAEEVAA